LRIDGAAKGRNTMSKHFYVEPGFLVRVGSLWHDNKAALFVEEDERAEIYLANGGFAGSCLGIYPYERLDECRPPMGLRNAPRCPAAGGLMATFGVT
jgi:hypothetical protein